MVGDDEAEVFKLSLKFRRSNFASTKTYYRRILLSLGVSILYTGVDIESLIAGMESEETLFILTLLRDSNFISLFLPEYI